MCDHALGLCNWEIDLSNMWQVVMFFQQINIVSDIVLFLLKEM